MKEWADASINPPDYGDEVEGSFDGNEYVCDVKLVHETKCIMAAHSNFGRFYDTFEQVDVGLVADDIKFWRPPGGFMTPERFEPESYKRTGWKVKYNRMSYDPNECRLIVHFVACRQYALLFTLVPDLTLGQSDPVLDDIARALHHYTFPMIDRFILELEAMLTDLYGRTIRLSRQYI